MNGVPANVAFDQGAAATEAGVSQPDDIKTVVAAIAVVLRETVAAFEDTVARITEITVTRPGRADRDLVVALQDFDRLQQEFATLSEVLTKLSAMSPMASIMASAMIGDAGGEAGDEVLSVISVADLKDRLARHMRSLMLDLSASKISEETVF